MRTSDARARPRAAGLAGRARGGFTLIEVLAAVALLGILYAVLARVAIEGLRAEGDSERRLEASLLADTSMNDVYSGTLPSVGHSETVDGDFSIALDVSAFKIPPQWGVGKAKEVKPLLLTEGWDGATPALRTVQLTVSWLEGASERHVSRTTYLLDFQSIAQLAAAAPNGQTPPEAGATGDERVPTEEDLGNPAPPEAP